MNNLPNSSTMNEYTIKDKELEDKMKEIEKIIKTQNQYLSSLEQERKSLKKEYFEKLNANELNMVIINLVNRLKAICYPNVPLNVVSRIYYVQIYMPCLKDNDTFYHTYTNPTFGGYYCFFYKDIRFEDIENFAIKKLGIKLNFSFCGGYDD